MCGRFYVDDETMQEIERIARRIDREKAAVGDIAPSQPAVVLQALEEEIVSRTVKWGYETARRGSLIFNARAETVQDRLLFSRDFEAHRCVIPAKKFYEWKSIGVNRKERYDFFVPEGILFLAGIYHKDPMGDRFTILTRAAKGCMTEVHDRMPVLLAQKEILNWLFSKEEAAKMLEGSSVQLRKVKSIREQYEQLRLF